MNFDLISDLHIDQWSDDKQINFKGLGTSLTCVVAGDVSQNIKQTRDFLYKLADSAYQAVIFIDGNHEHRADYESIEKNCEWFERELSRKSNITYLWDSTCVFGSTAFIGANGWWTYDYLEPVVSRLECINSFCQHEDLSDEIALEIWDHAVENSEFLVNIIKDFNKTDIIKKIVIVTHTLPNKNLIEPLSSMTISSLGKLHNSLIQDMMIHDTNKKINAWCFGHYHGEAVDTTIDDVRYISNPRGTPQDTIFPIYYPKLVTL